MWRPGSRTVRACWCIRWSWARTPSPRPERQRAGAGGEQFRSDSQAPSASMTSRAAIAYGIQSEFGEPLPAGGDLLGESDAFVVAGDQGEHGAAAGRCARVRGRGRRSAPRGRPSASPSSTHRSPSGRAVTASSAESCPVRPCAATVRTSSPAASPGSSSAFNSSPPYVCTVDGGSGALQQRHPRQHLRRLAQHQAERDGVQAGAAVAASSSRLSRSASASLAHRRGRSRPRRHRR